MNPNDELLPADRARIEAMRPDKRARALLEHKKAQKARQDRREATEQVLASGGVEYLEARSVAAQVAAVGMRPDFLALAAVRPEWRHRLDTLRHRAEAVVLAAALPTVPSAPPRGFENLDPAEFARRIQIRRRMEALKKRKASR